MLNDGNYSSIPRTDIVLAASTGERIATVRTAATEEASPAGLHVRSADAQGDHDRIHAALAVYEITDA